MKESTATTTITERRFEFTKAEVETLLRREILRSDVQAKIAFIWLGDEMMDAHASEIAVTAINTVTEYS